MILIIQLCFGELLKRFIEVIFMKNREEFAEEILDIVCKGDSFSVTKSGEITFCDRFKCDMCKFNDSTGEKSCRTKRYEWSESEYTEKPTITSREKKLLDLLLPECKYIARQKNNTLYIYYCKPTRNFKNEIWRSDDDYDFLPKKMYGDDIFSFIKDDDEEPWSIEDLKKLEVKS